jgi:Divergent InlB B-repeat domain
VTVSVKTAAGTGEKTNAFEYEAPPVNKYPLTITHVNSTVECNTGSGPEPCRAEYNEGTTVTVTDTPNSHYTFVGWSGACSSSPCQVTMTGPESVTATVEPTKYPLTITHENGTVECKVGAGPAENPCATEYSYGTTVKVTETANGGYTFTGWSGACTGAGACEPTITGPTSVTATFVAAAPNAQNIRVYGEPVTEVQSLETTCHSIDLGKWVPGVPIEPEGKCELTAESTAAESKLEAEDAHATEKGDKAGYLENEEPGGPFYLEEPLRVKATDAQHLGGGGSFVSLVTGKTLLSFAKPITPDLVTFTAKQHIGETEGLRKGEYEETVTLTLAPTNP